VLRRAVLPAASLLALALLAGCTPADDGTGPEPSDPATTPPTSEPTTAPTDQPVGTAVDLPCDQLISPDAMYQFNPNFGAIDDFAPEPGSAAASALTYDGVACRWENETTGQHIDVSVAHLDEDTLTALKNAAFAESEMVPTYGDEAYFAVTDGVGTAEVFQGEYWIVAVSPAFFEPGDATEIVQAAIAALGA
jgi:hypothetical protein